MVVSSIEALESIRGHTSSQLRKLSSKVFLINKAIELILAMLLETRNYVTYYDHILKCFPNEQLDLNGQK